MSDLACYSHTEETSETVSRLSYSRMDPEDAEVAFRKRKAELKKRIHGHVPVSSIPVPRPVSNCFKNITESFTSDSILRRRAQSQSRSIPRISAPPETDFSQGVSSGRVQILSIIDQKILKSRLGKGPGKEEKDGKKELFERQVQWKQKSIEKAEKEREIKRKKEMENCTFNPQLEKPIGPHIQCIQLTPCGKVHERSEIWLKEKDRKQEELKEMLNEKELESCPFHPKLKTQSIAFNSASYFQRQVDWKKNVRLKIENLDHKIQANSVGCPVKTVDLTKRKPTKIHLKKQQNDAETRVLKLEQVLGVLEDRVNSSLGIES